VSEIAKDRRTLRGGDWLDLDKCPKSTKIAARARRRCFWRILQKRLLPPTQQEIADAVGVTRKTVDNRLESLVNLDRCPKLLKIAALFEEAINAAGNVIGNVTVNVSCV
jgi:DNA-binding XRE family transcriptional regulator